MITSASDALPKTSGSRINEDQGIFELHMFIVEANFSQDIQASYQLYIIAVDT